MLYIQKKTPPGAMLRKVSSLKSSNAWKSINIGNTDAIRDAFNELPKEEIRRSLLEEQHYLCAYCMRKIEDNGLKTSIEHWYPLSKDKDKALDYKNMLAVCDGGRNWSGTGKKILCCDAYKSDEDELTILPLNKLQMDKIVYDTNGFIKTAPNDSDIDKDITEKLHLNGVWKKGKFICDTSTGIVKSRKDAYLQCKKFIRRLDEKGQCTSGNVLKKIEEIEKAEHRIEYAGVYLYFLKKKYRSMVARKL